VILLPVIAALGYFWLYQSHGVQLYQFQQAITPNFPFIFSPMFHLPFAATLAIGLWLYARVSLVNALLVIALVEALTLSTSFAYASVLAQFLTQRDLAPFPISLLNNAAAVVLSSLCYLLAASVWVPSLRLGRRWLAAVILWTVWATATTWAVRQLRLPLPQAVAIAWSLRVFIAACFGFWLWRDDPSRSQLSAPPRRGATDTHTKARQRSGAEPGSSRGAKRDAIYERPGIGHRTVDRGLVAAGAVGVPEAQLPVALLSGLSLGTIFALLGVGFVVIFREMGTANFSHGALLTLGAYCAYALLSALGLRYWSALVAAPLIVGIVGVAFERLILRGTYKLNYVYGILITLGVAFLIEPMIRNLFGASYLFYQEPAQLLGSVAVGPASLPTYRVFVLLLGLAACLGAWRIFGEQRASRPAPSLIFGIGAGLAALAGVLSAPIFGVYTTVGQDLIAPLFAVAIVAGTGSIPGVIVTALLLGITQALATAIFRNVGALAPLIVMVAVLLVRPNGLFGDIKLPEPPPLSTKVPKGMRGRSLLAGAPVVLFILALVPSMSPHLAVLLMYGMCFALFASAISLLLGQAGILSIGHAMFLAVGAYVTAMATRLYLPPELAILSSAAATAVIGFIAGVLVIRKPPIYSAMITAALAQIVYLVFLLTPVVGGDEGQIVHPLPMFGVLNLADRLTSFYVVTAIFVIGFLVIYGATYSSFGAALREIREGKRRYAGRYTVAAFMLSGAVAGVAGAALALVTQFVSPDWASLFRSTEGVLMVMIGGIGGVFGPLIGAFVVVIAADYLSTIAGQWATGVVAIALIVIVLLRAGLAAELVATARKS
jgi:branched-chain amino acid transport system permease protein